MSRCPPSVPAHEDIAALAYLYYLDEGCPEGRSEAHWRRAEALLLEQCAEEANEEKTTAVPKAPRAELPRSPKRPATAVPQKRRRSADETR